MPDCTVIIVRNQKNTDGQIPMRKAATMTSAMRTPSESGHYHLMMRGNGKRIIFEDIPDRRFFIERLVKCADRRTVAILAWTLMDNHFHLLIQCDDLDLVASFMRDLSSSYARHFNKCHDHTGHVFSDRYASVPIESDSQLLATIRYIHLNPIEAGIRTPEHYQWSSYRQYLGDQGFCDIELPVEMLGDAKAIMRFHNVAINDASADHSASSATSPGEVADAVSATSPGEVAEPDARRPLTSDQNAMKIMKQLFGENCCEAIASMNDVKRRAAIRLLHEHGLSCRQIARLTGISRYSVQQAIRQR